MEIPLDSQFSLIAAFLLILGLGIRVFSMLANIYEQETNRKFTHDLLTAFRCLGQQLNNTVSYGPKPSIKTTKFYLWLVIGIYCIFSAYFGLVAAIFSVSLATSTMTGLKLILALLFILVLMMLAKMYYVFAKKAKDEIDNLR